MSKRKAEAVNEGNDEVSLETACLFNDAPLKRARTSAERNENDAPQSYVQHLKLQVVALERILFEVDIPDSAVQKNNSYAFGVPESYRLEEWFASVDNFEDEAAEAFAVKQIGLPSYPEGASAEENAALDKIQANVLQDVFRIADQRSVYAVITDRMASQAGYSDSDDEVRVIAQNEIDSVVRLYSRVRCFQTSSITGDEAHKTETDGKQIKISFDPSELKRWVMSRVDLRNLVNCYKGKGNRPTPDDCIALLKSLDESARAKLVAPLNACQGWVSRVDCGDLVKLQEINDSIKSQLETLCESSITSRDIRIQDFLLAYVRVLQILNRLLIRASDDEDTSSKGDQRLDVLEESSKYVNIWQKLQHLVENMISNQ